MSFFKLLDKLDDLIASAGISLIVLITIAAVFMRYIMGDPLQWIEEVLVTLLIWTIMIGAVSAMKHKQHVSIDALTAMLPAKAQRYINIFNDILSIIILGAFGTLGFQLALKAQEKITPFLSIKYMYIDIAVPIGAFWMILHVLRHLYADIKNVPKE